MLFFLLIGLIEPALAQSFLPVQVIDQTWQDNSRHRLIPIKLRLPQGRTPDEVFPVIIFSHGLGGDTASGERWGEYWAANGYIVVHVQHVGSDAALLADRDEDRATVMRRVLAAANLKQLAERAGDVRFILDEAPRHEEFRQADWSRVGMSGHSFGAYTTQVLAGQSFSRRAAPLADRRIRAAIAFSPSVRNRVDAEMQLDEVTIPFMSLTGTLDIDQLGMGNSPEERLRPFYAMPKGGKYLVVFNNGDHAIFSGRTESTAPWRSPDAISADARIVRATQLLSLAFWDAYLKGNDAALIWLEQQSSQVLAPEDRFEQR